MRYGRLLLLVKDFASQLANALSQTSNESLCLLSALFRNGRSFVETLFRFLDAGVQRLGGLSKRGNMSVQFNCLSITFEL